VVELATLQELQAEYDEIAGRHPASSAARYEVTDAGGVSAEWVSGPWCREDSIVLYLHGGCYTSGSTETHRELIARVAEAAGRRALGLNYRLAPTHPFPAAVEDVVKAYRWLLDSRVQPAAIAVVGDSAGGGLALAVTLAARNEGLPIPGAVACISPWVDLALTGASMETNAANDPIVSCAMLVGWGNVYLREQDPRNPLASPLYADLRGLPPLLIQAASAEVLLDDATRLAVRAAASGVRTTLEIWPEMLHGLASLCGGPPSRARCDRPHRWFHPRSSITFCTRVERPRLTCF
jgi:acetyl esterase/lipase